MFFLEGERVKVSFLLINLTNEAERSYDRYKDRIPWYVQAVASLGLMAKACSLDAIASNNFPALCCAMARLVKAGAGSASIARSQAAIAASCLPKSDRVPQRSTWVFASSGLILKARSNDVRAISFCPNFLCAKPLLYQASATSNS